MLRPSIPMWGHFLPPAPQAKAMAQLGEGGPWRPMLRAQSPDWPEQLPQARRAAAASPSTCCLATLLALRRGNPSLATVPAVLAPAGLPTDALQTDAGAGGVTKHGWWDRDRRGGAGDEPSWVYRLLGQSAGHPGAKASLS